MKNYLLSILALVIIGLSSCGKDDNNTPDSPYKDSIVGTWELTHFDGVDVSTMPEVFTRTTTITFGSEGHYSGQGVLGDGTGTYTLEGSTIKTYIDGELFITYEIKSLANNIVEATMTDSSGSVMIKTKKR